jgi:hypothetical protein
LLDLDPGVTIAQTKQVNDLNSLETRQASYTNKFKIPKTATNVRIMQHLTLPGNTSNLPYQKNECSLYNDTGECFVYKGWAVISDGGEDYEAVIYDGIIDLYKAMENKTIADLNLLRFNHEKTVTAVKNTWNSIDPVFLYILADYNGNNGPTPFGFVNVDYLVPAVKVSFLIELYQYVLGIQWIGPFLGSEDFNDLYITYPKGVGGIESEKLLFESADYKFYTNNTNVGPQTTPPVLNKYYAQFNSTTTYTDITDTGDIHLKVPQAGTYRIEVSGKLDTYFREYGEYTVKQTDATIYAAKNSGNINPQQTQNISTVVSVAKSKEDFSGMTYINLEANDTVSIVISPIFPYDQTKNTFLISGMPNASRLSVKLTRVNMTSIDFTSAFADFSLTDFLKEIMHRYGLTIHKDKYSNFYIFRTLKDQLETDDAIDWSNKFAKKISENYIYGIYAQRNWFRYQYNDKGSAHNDGYLDVQNENLPETKTIITSKTYSPEKNLVPYFRGQSHVYKLWEKEMTEASGDEPAKIDYKPLDKRYYFLKAQKVNSPTPLFLYTGSTTGNSITSNVFYKESYEGLSYQDAIQNNYRPLANVLDKSLVITVELNLKDSDIANFDFKKLYYIAQLSGYFLVNKIINYISGKLTKCELVRVKHTPPTRLPVRAFNPIIRDLEISGVVRLSPYSFQFSYSTSFVLRYNLIYQYSVDNVTWRTAEYTPENEMPKTIRVPDANARYFRMLYEGSKTISNIFELND